MMVRSRAGFTLLEVMVSVTIIGIALVTLIGAQSQSISIATASRFETTASLLARQKMTELTLAGFDELQSDEGDFDEDFSDYHWKVDIRELGEDDTGIKDGDDMLKAVDLTITSDLETDERFVVRRIMMAPIKPVGSS
ncbi:MAG TPA: prepilin-type N-terminal cleavage/methylation domain-containing protein [Desulfobulbaceae bacterium]|nr:prepilin-type N-terminal cleavage/methylation domain-containing protein [Desulfobulbaceae bacterium]